MFRKLALALPEAVEVPHFQRASFRVNKKIFATLDQQSGIGVVKLTQADQSMSVESQPETFHLVGWANQGWTGIHLDHISQQQTAAILELAWKNVAPKRLVSDYVART